MNLIGIDIGGTKCAVSLGCADGQGNVRVLHKCPKRLTEKRPPELVLPELLEDVRLCLSESDETPKAIGISCGGPLSSKEGLVLSPPNLIGWDKVPIVEYFQKATGLPTFLCNDANAGALAEWRMGAGRGTKNIAAAVMTANSLGLHTIGLTGKDGGKLAELSELSLIMPQCETYRIQEDHLAIYHLLCAVVEYEMFL